MSKILSITVEKRELLGTANSRRMRRAGIVPAVIYSRGAEPISLSVKEDVARKLINHSGLVQLHCSCGTVKSAVVKDYQIHTISTKPLCVDFLEVQADELVTVLVRLVARGEAIGLAQGGQLEQVMHEIDIQAVPSQIPSLIEVDVSALNKGDAVCASDLKLGEGQTVVGDPDRVLFHVRVGKA